MKGKSQESKKFLSDVLYYFTRVMPTSCKNMSDQAALKTQIDYLHLTFQKSLVIKAYIVFSKALCLTDYIES